MRILISGSTGLVGTATVEQLRQQDHDVSRLVRPSTRSRLVESAQSSGNQDVPWDPIAGLLDSNAEGSAALIHLAGASIGTRRWTAARKRLIVESRVAATRHLVSALAKLRRPPQLFIAASAIGYYGDRGDEVLTEESSPGGDFLAKLTRDWEAESARAQEFGARVVILRFGIVLAKHGGALRQMALPFRFGLGGRIASGRQWMSWVTLEDVVNIISFAMNTTLLSGPANAVAPHPVPNREFAARLGEALHRPALFPAPAVALRLALGEMADSLLLASQRVVPQKLERLGYRFAHPELQPALEAILGRGH